MYRRPALNLFFIILLFSSFLFFFKLGDRSFRNPDEGRYAEIAREMIISGNWIQPKLYGVDYLKKPVLFYWFTAVFFKIFGMNEWSGRSVPALFGLSSVLMTFWFTRKVFDDRTAFFSSLALASNLFYLQVGRYLVIDIVFSFFVVAGLYFFYLAVNHPKNSTSYYLSFYICAALSFLAKGIIGVILPGIAIVLYLWLTKRMSIILGKMYLGWGIVIFSVIALPWFVLISIKEPEFLKLFFLHENLSRFSSANFEHQEPWFFYIVLMLAVLVPWSLFWRTLKRSAMLSQKEDGHADAKLFLFIASMGIILFFSLAKAKLMTYILPSIPFLSVLIGQAWSKWAEYSVHKNTTFKWPEYTAVFALILLGSLTITASPKVIARFGQDLPDGMGSYFQWMGVALFAGGIAALRALKQRSAVRLFYSLVFMMVFLSVAFIFAMEKINRDYSNKPFAFTLKSKLKNGDRVFIYDHPGALYDFAFYLNYPVTPVGLEGEFESSRNDPENYKAIISHEDFVNLLKRSEKVYCLARRSDFLELQANLKKNFTIMQEDRRKVLFST